MDNWRTPIELFERYNRSLNFTLDPAATHEHHLTDRYYCDPVLKKPDDDENGMISCYGWCLGFDGLMHSWRNERVWLNPPYSRGQIALWLKKAVEEAKQGCVVFALVPADPSTKWWQKYVVSAQNVEYLSKRVRFINPNTGTTVGSPTFPSAIVSYW